MSLYGHSRSYLLGFQINYVCNPCIPIHPVQLVLLYLSTLLDSWLAHCDRKEFIVDQRQKCVEARKYLLREYYLESLLHTGILWLNLYQNPKNIVLVKIWHCMALMVLQDTKKPISYWKRPKKTEKVILKAVKSKNGKIMIFLAFCDHLVINIKEIQYFDVSKSKRPKRPH